MQRITWTSGNQLRSGFLPPVRVAPRRQSMVGQQPSFGMAGRQHLAAPRYRMGATAQQWYERAQNSIARFDFLKEQVNSIDNVRARNNIVTWLGNASIDPSAEHTYVGVKDDYVNDVATKGIDGTYGVGTGPDDSGPGRRQNRITKLEEFNVQLNEMIAAVQAEHGTLPGTTPGGPSGTGVITPPKALDLTVPILIGAGAIALAIFATTALAKKTK